MPADARCARRRALDALFFVACASCVAGRAAARASAEDVRAMARPADARDAVSSAVLAVLRAPCDAYAKSFDDETAASLRAGARRALEAQCARAGGDETRSDACGTLATVADGARAMTRGEAMGYFKQAMHESCQSGAAAMSDPEKRDASEATRYVREAVTRAAEEEAVAGRTASAGRWEDDGGEGTSPATSVTEEGGDGRTGDRGMWGWDRDAPTQTSAEDAFGAASSVDSIKHRERQALGDMYRRTNGAKWRRRDGWMSSKSYCEWYGVTCLEKDFGVAFVDLRDNGMEGDMPQAIDELKLLQGLDLSYNRLEGRLSAMLGELKTLRYLLVRSNALYSDIPAGLFRKGSPLTQLDLSDNSLSGAIPGREFVYLTSLRMFNVSNNALTGTIPNIASLPALEIFSASTNALRGAVPHFDDAAKIRFFDVSKNALHGLIPSLSSVPSWVLFDVSHNSLTGELPRTALPRTLRVFSCANNNLNGTVPQTFAQLPKVEHLDFSANQFTGALPASVLQKKTLRYFNVSRNAFEGELPRSVYQGELERQSMRLEEFDVSHNKLTGALPQSIVELDRLRVIDVAHNALSGDLPSRWAVDRLERLDVKANAFTGAIPTILARATRLRHLDLSQNALRSRANLAVLTIPTLEHLDVSGNSLDWNEAAAAPAPKIDRARAIEPPSLHDDL